MHLFYIFPSEVCIIQKKEKKKRGIVLNKAKPLHYVYLQIL